MLVCHWQERKEKTTQEIKISNLTIPVPDGFEIVSKEEIEDLRKKADLSCWWTLKEVEKRYHRSRPWLMKVLGTPKFKKILENRSVMYADGGRRSYLFEPTSFSKFMRDWFPEIVKEMEEGILKK